MKIQIPDVLKLTVRELDILRIMEKLSTLNADSTEVPVQRDRYPCASRDILD